MLITELFMKLFTVTLTVYEGPLCVIQYFFIVSLILGTCIIFIYRPYILINIYFMPKA